MSRPFRAGSRNPCDPGRRPGLVCQAPLGLSVGGMGVHPARRVQATLHRGHECKVADAAIAPSDRTTSVSDLASSVHPVWVGPTSMIERSRIASMSWAAACDSSYSKSVPRLHGIPDLDERPFAGATGLACDQGRDQGLSAVLIFLVATNLGLRRSIPPDAPSRQRPEPVCCLPYRPPRPGPLPLRLPSTPARAHYGTEDMKKNLATVSRLAASLACACAATVQAAAPGPTQQELDHAAQSGKN